VKCHFIALVIIPLIGLGFLPAFGHTTVEVGPYAIEVGWGIEPPVVGIRNDFVFEISEPGETEGVKSGVKNAFKNLEATAKFGGITKKLDINADPRPGHYFSPVIPTRTGSLSVEVKGDLNGVAVDVDIPIEDVESTAVLDFPPRTGGAEPEIPALKNALSSIQKDVTALKSKLGGVDTSAGEFSVESAYNFGVFGLSLGAAAIILAIIAMIKRK